MQEREHKQSGGLFMRGTLLYGLLNIPVSFDTMSTAPARKGRRAFCVNFPTRF
ncbi:protein of unknown function [Ruminococcaceae bacterium BL-6]|nr:protein of unknown function [Ruminococcaceae bacterium BL-6]